MATALPPNLDFSALTTSAALFSPTASSSTSEAPNSTSPHPPPTPATPHPTYTLPQIRAIHAALLARVSDISGRLRTQVGGSYRDLLGTADAIVSMRADAEGQLLPTLGAMGGRCGRGVVGGKVEGLRGFVKVSQGQGGEGAGGNDKGEVRLGAGYYGEDMGVVARRRLLDGVLLGLGGVLRRGGSEKDGEGEGAGRGDKLALAARLYVLGRLLVKSFGEGTKDKVEGPRKSLETVHRARLARSIDAVLRSGSERAMRRGDVLKALSAYSLANSAGARDVLAHFLHVRAQAIRTALGLHEEDGASSPKDVLRALALYTKTLLDVQALVPHKLTEALVALRADRLLENASLKEMEGLRLDIYRRWCGDEIQFYTPFIRHDDLDGQQAREKLTSWAKNGGEVLLQGLEKTLESMSEFKAIVELRTSVLKLWIAQGGKARGFDPSVMLDQLRDAINKHMLRVLEAKVAKLRLVGSEVYAALDAWRAGVTDRHDSLWDVGSLDADLSHGAAQFTHDVVARLHGRNDAVSKAVASYQSWFHVIDDVGQVVDQLKRQRWDNDVDEIEDEETIEERQKLLSKEDPLTLSEHLNRLLVEAYKRLDEQLTSLWKGQQAKPTSGAVAMYFLRLLRDIRARLPDIEAVRRFGLSAVPSLQEELAKVVIVSPLDEFTTVTLARKTVVGRALWEGDPALPASPSPGTIRFLRSLTLAMGDSGGDLWSPAGVDVLKRQMSKQISSAWLAALRVLTVAEQVETKGSDEPEAEEAESVEEEESKTDTPNLAHQDLFVQWLLDIYYLRLFLAAGEGTFEELEGAVYQKSGLEAAARERLAKASQDYFKRTGLLFGLLA